MGGTILRSLGKGGWEYQQITSTCTLKTDTLMDPISLTPDNILAEKKKPP